MSSREKMGISWKRSAMRPDLFSTDVQKADDSDRGRTPMRKQNRLAVLRSGGAIELQALIVLFACWTAAAQNVQLYVSSKAGDRLTSKPEFHFEQRVSSESNGFEIDD